MTRPQQSYRKPPTPGEAEPVASDGEVTRSRGLKGQPSCRGLVMFFQKCRAEKCPKFRTVSGAPPRSAIQRASVDSVVGRLNVPPEIVRFDLVTANRVGKGFREGKLAVTETAEDETVCLRQISLFSSVLHKILPVQKFRTGVAPIKPFPACATTHCDG